MAVSGFIGQWHRRASVLAIIVSALAFFLRVYRLADQNVWWDEGWSIWLAQKEVAWIAWRTAIDEHPPLHYWMLHLWNFITGTNVFAGRFVSVAFGVLTIALVYRIGRYVGGPWIGVLAALFLATARFHIWWSQDVKNYTPSIFFVFVAVWFALACLIPPPAIKNKSHFLARHPQLLYALFAALALWTHYLAALVLMALNLYWFIVLIHPRQTENQKSKIINWLTGNFIAAFLFAPWLYLYLHNAAAWQAAPPFDFGVFIRLVATVLPLGVTVDIENYFALALALTILVVLGMISGQRLKVGKNYFPLATNHYPLLFALIIALPPLLVYMLSLTPVAFFAPKIQARYLLVLLPAYTILLAFGVTFLARLARPLAFVAVLAVLGANAFVLNDYYTARRWRDEYTTLANTINSFARQGDLVLLDTDQEWPTLLYYLRYPLDWLGVPNGKPMTEAEADGITRRVLNRYNAVWLVVIPDALATDPQKLLEARLARELPKRFEQAFDDKRLVLFARDERDLIQVAPENFAPQYRRQIKIEEGITLLGFDVPVRQVRVGDTLRLVTYWDANRIVGVSFDPQNRLTGTVYAGQRVRVQSECTIAPADVGDFQIVIRGIELARVQVHPRAEIVHLGSLSHRTGYRLGHPRGTIIHLVGYDLPQTQFRTGDTVPLTLYWRAESLIEKSFTVFVHLVGQQFNPKQNNPLWGQVDRIPQIPMTAWLPNEIVPDPYAVKIDPDAPPGKYKIEIGMYDAATGARLPTDAGDSITLAEIEIVR